MLQNVLEGYFFDAHCSLTISVASSEDCHRTFQYFSLQSDSHQVNILQMQTAEEIVCDCNFAGKVLYCQRDIFSCRRSESMQAYIL